MNWSLCSQVSSGKTAIYIFSDGGYNKLAGVKDPADKAAALAQKYDVCFMVIDYAQFPQARKMVAAMAEANPCSRVIPFDAYITQPYYGVGPLYYSKWNAEVESTSEKKVSGYKVNNILFEIDKFDFLRPRRKSSIGSASSCRPSRTLSPCCSATPTVPARRSTTWNCPGTEPRRQRHI